MNNNTFKRRHQIPRGLRNNNPLNIRIGNVWLGEVKNPTDPAFEQFVTLEYGLRAAFVLLRRYINHYHRRTIPEIIAAWAPATENNTTAYIDRVATISGIPTDFTLDYSDQPRLVALVAAMAQVECGQPIDRNRIESAYKMA